MLTENRQVPEWGAPTYPPRPPESSLRGASTPRKAPLELRSQACGDPSSPRAGGVNLPPCPSGLGASRGGGSSTRAAKRSSGRNSAETGPNLTKLGSPLDPKAAYPRGMEIRTSAEDHTRVKNR
ncbi:hypothetical protein ROHU_025546 [Labeo rohita]|uniref:Uncharacterized protein n=1 Tax=Labeo rohita TaxID=84645 RepID=A0A498MIU1_LABRO|nr:hypothetical protein ROHU_025546 [Labeo rohita]